MSSDALTSGALTFPSEQVVWRPKINPWAIGATVSMAAFVEVLDTSVANVALPYIAGGLDKIPERTQEIARVMQLPRACYSRAPGSQGSRT